MVTRNKYEAVLVYIKSQKWPDKIHTLSHLDRVLENALKITKLLNVGSQIDLNLLKVICVLHDVTYTKYEQNYVTYFLESKFASSLSSEILRDLDFAEEDIRIAVNAISKHTHSFPFGALNRNGDNYTKILQDADTLDLFNKERLEEFKKKRHFKYIDKIFSVVVDHGAYFCKKYLGFLYLNNPGLSKYFNV